MVSQLTTQLLSPVSLKAFIPLNSGIDQMYTAIVRSHLDYCDIIYHIPCLNSLINLVINLLI